MTTRDIYTFANQASLPPRIPKALRRLYSSWDDKDTDHDYLNFFAPDAVLAFSPTAIAHGRDAIRALRDGMLHPNTGPLVGIRHTLDKCWFPAGAAVDSDSKTPEVLVTGTIWYELRNGRRIDGQFSSYAAFSENKKGELESTSYIVYFDTLELMTAIKEQAEAAGSS